MKHDKKMDKIRVVYLASASVEAAERLFGLLFSRPSLNLEKAFNVF